MSITSNAPDIDLSAGNIPRHVAIIMDGNNRWAQQRSLPGAEGHKAGEQAVQTTIEACAELGVEVLTLFAFSSENWRRPEDEVQHLMSLFLRALQQRVAELNDNNVCLRFIGARGAFSSSLQKGMAEAEALTANNTGLTVVVAVNYGGQWDIVEAAKQVAEQVANGSITPSSITDEYFSRYIQLADLPAVDLLIRTGGEYRVSNFLLWQFAYSELYFSPVLWPDFNTETLAQAVNEYKGRQRRFGRSGTEVAQMAHQKDKKPC